MKSSADTNKVGNSYLGDGVSYLQGRQQCLLSHPQILAKQAIATWETVLATCKVDLLGNHKGCPYVGNVFFVTTVMVWVLCK